MEKEESKTKDIEHWYGFITKLLTDTDKLAALHGEKSDAVHQVDIQSELGAVLYEVKFSNYSWDFKEIAQLIMIARNGMKCSY